MKFYFIFISCLWYINLDLLIWAIIIFLWDWKIIILGIFQERDHMWRFCSGSWILIRDNGEFFFKRWKLVMKRAPPTNYISKYLIYMEWNNVFLFFEWSLKGNSLFLQKEHNNWKEIFKGENTLFLFLPDFGKKIIIFLFYI